MATCSLLSGALCAGMPEWVDEYVRQRVGQWLELRLVLDTRQDVRLDLHQLRLEASSCSARELTALDTERSSHRPRVS
jgi:hypothetical protein